MPYKFISYNQGGHAIVPIPSDPKLYDDQVLEDGSTSQPWYDWNISNWGTKWNAINSHLERMGEDVAIYNFDTAWSPPMPVIDKLRKLFPTMGFFYRYEEEQGWGGEVTIRSCLLYTSPSPRDRTRSRMPSSA